MVTAVTFAAMTNHAAREPSCPMTMTPETARTFIAIAAPEALNRQLAGLQAALAPDISGCRWTSTMPFHATLAFLGDVRTRDLDQLCNFIAASTESLEPFDVDVLGLGAFPSASRPRVIWAGLSAPNMGTLLGLRVAVLGAVAQAGHRVDDERFHPHLTLGRIKPDRRGGGDLSGLMERYRGWSGGGFTVNEVVTFTSTLGPNGPSYDPIGRAALAGKKTEAPP